MLARDFCFWLQGYFEIDAAGATDTPGLSSERVAVVQRHLALVFAHDIDPSMGPKKVQDALNAIHNPPGKQPTVFPGDPAPLNETLLRC